MISLSHLTRFVLVGLTIVKSFSRVVLYSHTCNNCKGRFTLNRSWRERKPLFKSDVTFDTGIDIITWMPTDYIVYDAIN